MVAMKMEHTIKAPKDGVIKQVIGIEGEVFQKNFVRRVILSLDRWQESITREVRRIILKFPYSQFYVPKSFIIVNVKLMATYSSPDYNFKIFKSFL